jgi:hypothetical protein
MALLATVAAASAIVFALVRTSIIDDAYITLSYARNVAFHLHWGLNPQQTSNTATSPLNVLILALLTAALRQPMFAMAALFVAVNVVLAYALLRVTRPLRLPPWSAGLGCAIVLVNPLLDSAVGLETALAAALLALLLMAAVEVRRLEFGLYAGLLLLTRIDLAIFVVVLFIGAGRRLWRELWAVLLVWVAVALPWFLWSWVALGSAMPDTLLVKTLGTRWGHYQFGNGPLLYLQAYPTATILSFLPAVLGLTSLLIWTVTLVRKKARPGASAIVALGLGGVLYYIAFSHVGVAPYHWYYGPPLISLSIVFACSVGALAGERHRLGCSRRETRDMASGLLSVVAAGLALCGGAGYLVSHGVPWQQAAITTNWATPAQYRAIGFQLRRLGGRHGLEAPAEIGSLAYYCQCDILNSFSDRGQTLPLIEQSSRQSGSIVRWLIDLNYQFLDKNSPPVGADFVLIYTKLRPVGGTYWPVTSSWSGPGDPRSGFYRVAPLR